MAAPSGAEITPARSRLAHPITAWSLAMVALALFVTDAVVYFSPITPPALFQAGGGAISAFWLFPYVSVVPVGLLIALRRPSNIIGWLALSAVLLLGLGAAAALVGSVLVGAQDSLGGPIVLLSALWNAPGGGATLTVLTVMLLLFPDGHLPSKRWAWLLYGLIADGAIGLVLAVIDPTPGVLGLTAVPTPGVILPVSVLAIPGTAGVVGVLSTIVSFLYWTLAACAVVSMFLRMRGADADQRHQIKWVAFAAVATLTTVVVLNVIPLGNTGEPPPLYFAIAGPLLVLAGIAVPTAIGLAVLKYRLYDIDVILSRTLAYGALAAFITAVYIGIAVGIGTLVGSGGQPNLWLSIIATIIVAVGFQPVRERVQKIASRLVYGNRATPYEVLTAFSEQVAGTYAADEVLPRMARVLQEGTGADSTTVWLRGAGELRPAATFPEAEGRREPLGMTDETLPELPGATTSVRVEHQGHLLGALSVVKRKGESLTPTENKLVEDLANQAGLVLRNVGLATELQQRLEELRASRQRLVQAQDEERRRLERNLHDGAQQYLVAIKVKLGLAQMLAARSPERARVTVAQLKADADEALETLRDLARGIYPPLLADKGLVVALESQARKATVPVRVEAEGVERYAQDVEATVYFCVLEAMQNVQKYAGASHADVRLRDAAGRLTFEVVDDGAGFDIAMVKKGAGLTNMMDRLDAIGGGVDVISSVGTGTRVCGDVPVPVREAALA
ncbi:MAG: GAF domain-containing sensor histidine kinase [Candidatus Dormibacteria bacterium]